MGSLTQFRLWTIVTCMGRLAFVRRTLPSVLAHLDGSYCLVDYSCPDHSGDWLRQHCAEGVASGRVTVLSVPGRKAFHKAEALNRGAQHAILRGAEYLCFLDADTVACAGLGRFVHDSVHPERFLVALQGRSLFGFLVVATAAFVRAGGFDESIRGYGGEDIEMRLRLHLAAKLGYVAAPSGLLHGLSHADELRTQHYAQKNRELSNAENLAYVRRRVEEWTGRELFELDPSIVRLYRRPPDERRPVATANLRARRRALVRARLRAR